MINEFVRHKNLILKKNKKKLLFYFDSIIILLFYFLRQPKIKFRNKKKRKLK